MSQAPDALAAFFIQAAEEFDAAAVRAGLLECDLVLAGRRVRLRFAGPELRDALLPALAPRVSAAHGTPDAEIRLWEERVLEGAHVPVPWRDHHLAAGGLLRVPQNDRLQAVHEWGSGGLNLIDRVARQVLYRVASASQLPWWERAAPLRPALMATLAGPRHALVHGGAVGDRRGAVLLAGAGGVGKTTLALAALEAGMSYLADDYLLLEEGEQLMAWSLFATAKLDRGHVKRVPGLAGELPRPNGADPEEKLVLDVWRSRPAQLLPSLPVRAVIVPHIGSGKSSLRPLRKAQAMLALAPSTVFQMPYDDGRAIPLLTRVARTLPCFSLEIGEDPAELPVRLREALERAGAPRPAVDTAP